jgi:hypothetical protein
MATITLNGSTRYSLVSVTAATKTIVVSGDAHADVAAGLTLRVSGTPADNATYTVVSSTYSAPNTTIVVLEPISADYSPTWTETQPAGSGNKNWSGVASNSDGTRLIAANIIGRLYLSTNSGTSWTETQPAGAVNKQWYSVASDATGQKLVATINNSALYTTTNGGANWVRRYVTGTTDPKAYVVSITPDGSKIITGADNSTAVKGGAWRSADGGATWTRLYPKGVGDTSGNWTTCAQSADGTVVIFADEFSTAAPGRVWLSKDSGTTWTEIRPTGTDVSLYCVAIHMSADGMKFVVQGSLNAGSEDSDAGRIWTSSDQGATWIERQPRGNIDQRWMAGAMSADGMRLLAATEPLSTGGNSYVFLSSDGGATWTEQIISGRDAQTDFYCAACNANGTSFIVGGGDIGGRLYAFYGGVNLIRKFATAADWVGGVAPLTTDSAVTPPGGDLYSAVDATGVAQAADAAALNTTACEAERLASCPASQAALPGLAAGTAAGGAGDYNEGLAAGRRAANWIK